MYPVRQHSRDPEEPFQWRGACLLGNSRQDRRVIQGSSQFLDYKIAYLSACLIHLCAALTAPCVPNKQEVYTSNFTTVEMLTVLYTDRPVLFLAEHLISQRPQKNIVVPFLTQKHFCKGVFWLLTFSNFFLAIFVSIHALLEHQISFGGHHS